MCVGGLGMIYGGWLDMIRPRDVKKPLKIANPLLLKISSSFHVAGNLTRGRYLHDSFR